MRPLEDRDSEALWPYVSRPEFPVHMSWLAHTDIAQTRAFIAVVTAGLVDNSNIVWGIEYGGRVVGTIGLDCEWTMRALQLHRAELGYWIAPELWGQGLMTEAATAVVAFGFTSIGLHKITVTCFGENVGSRRVIEKVGFRYVGRAVEDLWRDGAWHDHLKFELTQAEWLSRPRPT